jgi:hypothetical protein
VIALTQKDVLAHEATVPWSQPYQVEQDLLLSLAMRAIFEDRFLSGQVAMRGGTVLHKVHLAPAARYSEDIDLVAVGDRPEGHIRKALLRVLRPLLGREKSSVWDSVQLAVRNAAKPSRILRCIFKLPSVAEPGRELTIEVEVNVTERIPHFPVQRLPFTVEWSRSCGAMSPTIPTLRAPSSSGTSSRLSQSDAAKAFPRKRRVSAWRAAFPRKRWMSACWPPVRFRGNARPPLLLQPDEHRLGLSEALQHALLLRRVVPVRIG